MNVEKGLFPAYQDSRLTCNVDGALLACRKDGSEHWKSLSVKMQKVPQFSVRLPHGDMKVVEVFTVVRRSPPRKEKPFTIPESRELKRAVREIQKFYGNGIPALSD